VDQQFLSWESFSKKALKKLFYDINKAEKKMKRGRRKNFALIRSALRGLIEKFI